eukprot:7016522-Pyramimonas_sp.AAC.2
MGQLGAGSYPRAFQLLLQRPRAPPHKCRLRVPAHLQTFGALTMVTVLMDRVTFVMDRVTVLMDSVIFRIDSVTFLMGSITFLMDSVIYQKTQKVPAGAGSGLQSQ